MYYVPLEDSVGMNLLESILTVQSPNMNGLNVRFHRRLVQ